MMKKILTALALATLLIAANCATTKSEMPSWFIHPKQNDSANLYGVAEGFTLEEATRNALSDAAARLVVTISSESTLLREENNVSVNEEMRQKVQQNIEKIDFINFKVSKSDQFNNKLYVEVQINRADFIDDQQKKVGFLEKQIADLDQNSRDKNIISRRNALVKIVELGNDLELRSRLLNGAGFDIKLEQKLFRIAEFKTLLTTFSDRVEFFFDINSSPEISKIIRSALNREQIKISSTRSASKNQVVIRIRSENKSNEIYGAYITKLEVDFENIVEEKVAASNTVEVSGSSTISQKESYSAALKSLEGKIAKEGIMKLIGLK